MIFEEALAQMRKGKKIRHPMMEPDEYFQACRVGLVGDDTPIDDLPISIVKMKGDRQHDVMAGKLNYVGKIKKQLKEILSEEDYKKYDNICTEIEISKIFYNDIFAYPQLNLFLVMSEDWRIYEDEVKINQGCKL